MKKKIISTLLVVMLLISVFSFTGCKKTEQSGYITPTNTEELFVFEENGDVLIREDVVTLSRNEAAADKENTKNETTEDVENVETENTENAENTETADITEENTDVTVENNEPVVEKQGKQTKFLKVDENDNFVFYFNEEILEFALYDKNSKQVWYSNPAPGERSVGIIGEMSSQISLFALNKKEGSQKTYESYTDCIIASKDAQEGQEAIKQYYLVNHNGNLRVIYILGRIKADYVIPTCLEGDMADELVAKFKASAEHKSAASFITTGGVYAKITPATWKTFNDDNKSKYLAIAPNMEEILKEGKTVYIIKDQTKWNNSRLMTKLQSAMVEAGGMTLELRDELNEKFGFVSEPAKTFWVPVDYELTESGLSVSIANDEIQYDTNTFSIVSINVLPYFGSGSESENGYMFLPDGSGAIVNFNNGKTNITSDIRIQLYGLDDGRESLLKPFSNERTSLPVFGIKKTDNKNQDGAASDTALFAIIESGDTNATIIADIAGKNKTAVDRNKIYTSFKMSEYEELQFKSAGKTSRIYQANMNSADIKISYTILQPEKASYNGMAEVYRNYLIDKGVISKKDYKEIPFNIEIVGAYDKDTAFLGISYTEMKALTTFDQCQEIIKKLSDAGIKNISINYKGWANNGLRNTAFNRAKVLKELGGKNGLQSLLNFAESLGVNIFFETELALVFETKMFDGYSELTQASRLVTRDIAYHYQYFNDWNTAADTNRATIVSPTIIYNVNAEDNSKSFATKLLADINELNIKGVSLGSLAYNLPGNYKIKDFSDREQVSKTYAAVAEMFGSTLNLMGKGVNSYMLPYVDEIFEISNTSSKFNLADESVPFYQMVIHGSIEYSGEPINLNGDTRNTFLQAVEAGSGLYYRWCYVANDEVKDLWYDGMYSLSYESWIDSAIEMYKEYNELLASTAGAFMVEHSYVAEDVAKVVYDNDVVVYVNYNSTDYTAEDGTVVKAESFAKGGNN